MQQALGIMGHGELGEPPKIPSRISSPAYFDGHVALCSILNSSVSIGKQRITRARNFKIKICLKNKCQCVHV